MQLAVRWCGVAAVLASAAALAFSIASLPAPATMEGWSRFESHSPDSPHFANDQPAFLRCLSSVEERVAIDFFPDGSIRSVSTLRGSAMHRCLRHEYDYPHFANHVRVSAPDDLGLFVPCAQAPVGEPEALGDVFMSSREQLARCVPAPRHLRVEVPRIQAGAMVFDPADVPSARCIAALTCGHRYRFGADVANQGIMISVP